MGRIGPIDTYWPAFSGMDEDFCVHIPTSHPFEEEVATEIHRMVKRHNWPIDRAGLSVYFVMRQSEHSSSDVKECRRVAPNQVTGWVRLWFNHLFLIQNPGLFLRQIVPHEMAHAWCKAQSVAKGEKPHNRHDNIYIARHQSLTQQPVKDHSELMSAFDTRALRLSQSGWPARCSCEGDAGFWVLKSTTAKHLSNEPIKCRRCGGEVAMVDDEQVPEAITTECQYIHWWKSNGRISS